MGEILTNHLCPTCSVYHRKNRNISGDYDEEGRLLTYCPRCGVMHPPLEVCLGEKALSNRVRHMIGTKVAIDFDLPYKEIHIMTKDLRFVDDDIFVQKFTKYIFQKFGIHVGVGDTIRNIKGSKNIIDIKKR